LLLMSKIELRDGHLSAARDAITSALLLPDPGPETYYVAGLIEMRYDHFDAALEQFSHASVRNPNEPEYVLARAEAMVKLNRGVEALTLVESRVVDFSDESSLWLFLAETNQMLGLAQPSIDAFREAARRAPNDQTIREQFGLALESAQQDEEAVTV